MKRPRSKNYFYHAIRIFTGLLFVIIAGSKLGILPSGVTRPEAFTPEGWAFIMAIDASGYLFPVIGIISLICGLAFLVNRYVALGAILLVPITFNFVLFHIFLGFSIDSVSHFFRESAAYIVFALNLYLIYSQRKKYSEILRS